MVEFSDLFTIERLKNIAANGRLFNVLTFVLVLFITAHFDRNAVWLAFFPILSIGAVYVGESVSQRIGAPLAIAALVFGTLPLLVVFYL